MEIWNLHLSRSRSAKKSELEISAGYEDVPPPRQRGERIQAGMRSKLMEEAERADCRDTDPEPFLGFDKHTKIR